jgi:hypothetical protein
MNVTAKNQHVRFVFLDGTSLECSLDATLYSHLVHLVPENEFCDIVVNVEPDTFKLMLELLKGLSDIYQGPLVLALSEDHQRILDGIDLASLVKYLHTANHLNIVALEKIFAETLYERFVKGIPLAKVFETFKPFLSDLSPVENAANGSKRSRDLVSQDALDSEGTTRRDGDSTDCNTILNDDEWIILLSLWDYDLLLSNPEECPAYINGLLRRDKDLLSLLRQSMHHDLQSLGQEAQLNLLNQNFKELIMDGKRSWTASRLHSAYWITFRFLTAKPSLIRRTDIFAIAKTLLKELIKLSILEVSALLNEPHSSPGAAASRLLQAWREARAAAHRLSLVGSYAARFNENPREEVPWQREPLRILFRAEASDLPERIAAALASDAAEAGAALALQDSGTVPIDQAAATDAAKFVQALADDPTGPIQRQFSDQLPPSIDTDAASDRIMTIETYDHVVLQVKPAVLSKCRAIASIVSLPANRPASIDGVALLEKEAETAPARTLRLSDNSCTATIISRIFNYLEASLNLDGESGTGSSSGGSSTSQGQRELDSRFADESDEIIFQTIMAANFLDAEQPLQVMYKKVADEIKKCKTPEEIQSRFNIRQEYTPVPTSSPQMNQA